MIGLPIAVDGLDVFKVVQEAELQAVTVAGWRFVAIGQQAYEMQCWKESPCPGPKSETVPCRHSVYAPSYCAHNDSLSYTAPAARSVYVVGISRDEWKALDAKHRLGETA